MIPLPIGISFFTFQGISLVVEVFRDKTGSDSPRRVVPHNFIEHLKNTALFKSFFPYLIAGPIVKAHEFYPQSRLKSSRTFDGKRRFAVLFSVIF